jgi:hypothetical protein
MDEDEVEIGGMRWSICELVEIWDNGKKRSCNAAVKMLRMRKRDRQNLVYLFGMRKGKKALHGPRGAERIHDTVY